MSILTPHRRIGRAQLLAALAGLTMITCGLGLAASPARAGDSLVIYSNNLSSARSAAKIRQYGKANCSRKGSTSALRVKVGKATRECFFNVPVVGRDLQATITARLFKSTPKSMQKRAWVAVNLRQARDGSRYQMVVMPRIRGFALRKIFASGRVEALAHGKGIKSIQPLAKANRITFRAYNGSGKLPAGTARLIASVNGKRLALVDDKRASELSGRDTTVSIGSKKNSRGASGSFIRARVAMPDPF